MEIAPERLREIREALLFGEPIDGETRLELLALLEFATARLPAPRGRPIDADLRRRAGVVGVLHVKHRLKLELALNIVGRADGTERDRARDRERLRYAFRKLKASGEAVRVPERDVTRALALAAGRVHAK